MSASEWPSSPRSLGTVTPPRISGRPAARRCTSHPMPVRNSFTILGSRGRLARHFFGQEQARQFHVGRLGDFDVAIAALHYMDVGLFQALHQAGFVGAAESVYAGLGER